MKAIIFGTGAKAIQFAGAIALNFDLIGFCETNVTSQKKTFLGQNVYTLQEVNDLDVELIIICSSFLSEITDVLINMGLTNFRSVDDILEVTSTILELQHKNEIIEEQKLAKMTFERLKEENIQNARLLTNRHSLLEKLPKNSIGAEIGVAAGEFTADIMNVICPKKLHLIDIWGSDRYNEKLLLNIQKKYKTQLDKEQLLIHRKLSLDAVADFADNYFDWVYIDTDHSYHTTYQELNLFSKKVKPDGWILGHDYCMGNWVSRYKYGVIEAVHRFCVESDYEIVYLSMEIAQSFALRKIAK